MAAKELHPQQQKLLELLIDNREDPLTFRDLQARLKMSSPSVVAHHVAQLEKKGYLKRNPDNPADYQILHDKPEKLISYVNLYGLAQCGPKGSLLDGNPLDRIPIASKLVSFPVAEAFMVKARGDSMAPKISSGDYVVARKAKRADNGDVVVCVNDGEALIKKLSRFKGATFLVSLNDKYPPFPAAKDFRVEGVVKSVISYGFG